MGICQGLGLDPPTSHFFLLESLGLRQLWWKIYQVLEHLSLVSAFTVTWQQARGSVSSGPSFLFLRPWVIFRFMASRSFGEGQRDSKVSSAPLGFVWFSPRVVSSPGWGQRVDNIEKCYNAKWFLTWGPKALFDVQGKCCQYGPEPGYKPQVCSGVPRKGNHEA